tara:strand:+ start:1277 stop:1426 length:150 start_codon:yes stop_codon:yes gene_type:complete
MTLDKKNKLLRNKELALKLSMADSEKKVVTILKSHGYWELRSAKYRYRK